MLGRHLEGKDALGEGDFFCLFCVGSVFSLDFPKAGSAGGMVLIKLQPGGVRRDFAISSGDNVPA